MTNNNNLNQKDKPYTYNKASLRKRYNESRAKSYLQKNNPFVDLNGSFNNSNRRNTVESNQDTNRLNYPPSSNRYSFNTNNSASRGDAYSASKPKQTSPQNNYTNYNTNTRYNSSQYNNQNKAAAHTSYNTQSAQNKYQPIRNIGKKKDRSARRAYSSVEKIILFACSIVFVVSLGLISRYLINAAHQESDLNKIRAVKEQSFGTVVSPTPENTPLPTPISSATIIRNSKKAVTIQNTATAEPTKLYKSPSKTERTIARSYSLNPTFRIRDKFFDLLDLNEDIVGWIKIGDFLDQPVVKRDNKYYLTRNFLKETNPAGAIFLDESTDLKYPPENLIVHGHNMKNGSMFGKLIHYKIENDTSFYLKYPLISLDTLYEDAQYIIFAVCEIETDYNHPNYFPFIAYSSFKNDSDAADYIQNIKSRSIFDVPIDVNPDDNLLTLATCSRTSESTRLLVVARKIRDGESKQKIKDIIYSSRRIRK